MSRRLALWGLACLVLSGPGTARAFESGDYALGLSLGRHRAGLLLQVFVGQDVALELYGYSLGFLGAGVVAYPFGEEDASVVASVTRIAAPRIPFLDRPQDRARPRARYALSTGLAVDFGHVSRRNTDFRGNTGDSFFAALGPTFQIGEQPMGRQRGFLTEARRLSLFYQLGIKSFYR